MKSALLAASLVLLGGSLAGCSGGADDGAGGGPGDGAGGGAPTDATEDEFCQGYRSLFEDMSTMSDASNKEIVATLQTWATSMEETGTPEAISADARAGFETTMDQVGALEEDATQKDVVELEKDLSGEERKQVEEFGTYTTELCGSPLDDPGAPEAPSEEPSQ